VRVTGGRTDEALARLVVRGSAECPAWMQRRHQAAARPAARFTLGDQRPLLGGDGAHERYYAAAERLGIRILYDAQVVGLDLVDGRFRSASVTANGSVATIAAKSVVLAAGGFESNLDWLREIWGEAADNFIIRGTPYNTGAVLRLMLDAGAQPVADPTQFHCVAVDARAPKFDGGIVTRLDSVSLGIVVNARGDRFHDEGEDFWPKRYAIWGRLVAQQPGQIAYSIVDAKAIGHFMPSMFPPKAAQSIPGLAGMLDLAPDALARTVDQFNRAVVPGSFDHSSLDDCRTEGLTPNKTHWARPLDTPPFWGYPLRPGITTSDAR
jgi:tricarballylate dehydrogenase